MLFNSFHFLFFFIIIAIIYFASPHKYRWMLLLASSCYFYMVFVPVYILILGFTIVVDYFAGILIENAKGKRRRLFLIVSLIANIGVLSVFKYYNFFNENLTSLLHGAGFQNPIPYLSILLPVGLSFHTFQAMSYTMEIYYGRQKAEKHFGIYSLYVMFFPQLVAGPIERPQNLLWQFRTKKEFDYERITSGLKLVLWGAFKKMVIADRLAVYVGSVYSEPHMYSGFPLLLATVFFAFQVYCDFSGYSDIAIGTARILGFNLMKNFNLPYQSKTVSEFWTRWHISLSSWLRDYLYEPIAIKYRNHGTIAIIIALLITFTISGLWHGAGWNFIILGVLNGVMICIELLLAKRRKRLAKKIPPIIFNAISVILTFSFVNFTFIFFRAHSVSDAVYIITNIFNFKGFDPEVVGLKRIDYAIIICSILIMEAVQLMQSKQSPVEFLKKRHVVIRWSAYITLALLIVFLGKFGSKSFIYFQF